MLFSIKCFCSSVFNHIGSVQSKAVFSAIVVPADVQSLPEQPDLEMVVKNLAPVLLDEPLSTAAPSLSSCRPARRELTSKTPKAKPIFQKRWAIFSAKPKVGVFVWLQAVNIW